MNAGRTFEFPSGLLAEERYRSLNSFDQWTLLTIMAQPDMSWAGIIPETPTRWSQFAEDATGDAIRDAIARLNEAALVKADDGGTLLVRPALWDRRLMIPNVRKAAERHLARANADDWIVGEVREALDSWADAEARNDTRAKRLRAASGRHTATQIADRIAFYGGRCWMCKVAPYEHLDHVIPVALGGTNWPANLRPACTACNLSKGAKKPAEVMA